ncbi:hypothetical protein [Arsenicitalea aurantiaca]|nr:hypothetical protein [Arsenicitalea aurantiaca]
MKYEVLRRHIGDKQYEQGDEREAVAADVAHLVKAGVLREAGEKKPRGKAEPAPKNKAEPAPANKAGPGRG